MRCGTLLSKSFADALPLTGRRCKAEAMIAVLEDPVIRARVPAMSVENYHRMAELGMLAPNVELIRGALIEKMPKLPLRSSIVGLLYRFFLSALPAGWYPRAEQPLTFADSEPEPD